MRSLIALSLAASLALAGCTANAVLDAATGTWPIGTEISFACKLIGDADGYVTQIGDEGHISAATLRKESTIMQGVRATCSNPPVNAVAALQDLWAIYQVVQANAKRTQ